MENARHYYNNALKNNLLRRYDEAITGYSNAIETDPSFVQAYLRRGTLRYRILKKYEDALADFEKAVELDPEDAVAYLHRGIVKCHLLKFDDAIPDFDRAIELDPNDERAYINRGKARYILRRPKEDVCEDLEYAIRLGSGQAADMMQMFYGKDEGSIRETIDKGIVEKARKIKK